jgi:hypothetical protein
LWLVVGVVVLLLAWQAVAELIEPHLLLMAGARLRPGPPPLEIPAAGQTRLRLYADPRPHAGKISGVQKGLVWVADGREMIEEGFGFGCPIIEADGHAFLSRHATTDIEEGDGALRLVKRYRIDTIDRPIRLLRRKYAPVATRGTVTFRYDVRPGGLIEVDVDFSDLGRTWQRAFIMNEQGARRFTRYTDDRNTAEGPQIGIWQPTDAGRGCFTSSDGRHRFCVELVDRARLVYGRERYTQRVWRGLYVLSWSGIDIEVDGPRPRFRYRLELEAQ